MQKYIICLRRFAKLQCNRYPWELYICALDLFKLSQGRRRERWIVVACTAM
jgi:hypothetical protein